IREIGCLPLSRTNERKVSWAFVRPLQHPGLYLSASILFGVLFGSAPPTSGQVNAWTKSSSGNCEEPYWSLARLPRAGDSVMITNGGWKAIQMGNSTAVNYPSSLAANAIEIRSPVDSFNTLILNYVGTQSPL